jgi:catechol 2,3-dioxygenase-like lactoylglutathione lyase family enzyme
MYQALHLSPMIPSFDIQKTGRFFKEVLGFIPVMDSETYSIYEKDNLTIHILRAGQDIGQMEFYLEVDNVDNLWITIKDQLKNLKVREPFNQDYGMREIHIGVPHTNTLLFIGQEIKADL